MRRDPGLLVVPQDPLEQTDFSEWPPGGFPRPKHDEQWRLS